MASENELRALLAEARECVRDFGETLTCDAESHRFHTSPCQACYVGAVADRIDAALAEPVLAAETNYYAEFNAMRDKAAKYGLEATQMRKERDEARAEVERLRGLTPELPPRPPDGDGLPRYGLRWNGPTKPLAVPLADGYWTPWHLADAAYQRGAEAMREAAASIFDAPLSTPEREVLLAWAESIRVLPVPKDKP